MTEARPVLAFTVPGVPIPQGSLRPRPIYVGRGRARRFTGKVEMVNDSEKVGPWRDNVTWQAIDAQQRQGLSERLEGPLKLDATFMLPRPKSHYRTGRNSHLLAPDAPAFPIAYQRNDLDKLVRAIMDGLTDAKVWHDDSQVVAFGDVGKWYAERGERACCQVVVHRVTQARFGVSRPPDRLDAAETLPIAGEVL